MQANWKAWQWKLPLNMCPSERYRKARQRIFFSRIFACWFIEAFHPKATNDSDEPVHGQVYLPRRVHMPGDGFIHEVA